MARREREGRSIPVGFLDKPELQRDLVFVWDAFWRLHTERSPGMGGPGAIPFSAVLAYAYRLGMGSDETGWFADLIAAMDDAWFAHQSERREAAARIEEAEAKGAKPQFRGK